MTTIYHNPRCSKSRQGLALVEASGLAYSIVLYLKEQLTFDDIKTIISKLGIEPIDLVRKGEAIWKESYKKRDLTTTEIIEAMVENPTLIERPIVIHGDKGVIGRPPENIKAFLSK